MAGDVYLRVTSKPWHQAGKVEQGRYRVETAPLPVGGPYTVELQVRNHGQVVNSTTITDLLVGDLWLCAGQSNMQGCGLKRTSEKPEPMVRAFFMDDSWGVAREPFHNLSVCVDQVHIDLSGGSRPKLTDAIVGPAIAFAREMWRRTGVPQGLIACAHGGTSMPQWDPALAKQGSRSLYGAMLRRLRKNGGRVAGLIWYQGESDATPAEAGKFTGRMTKFLQALRKDCNDPNLPVVMAQLSRVVRAPEEIDPVAWNSIQEQQRRLPHRVKRLATVPTIDLPLDDTIHISAQGQQVLGARMAEAMHVMATHKLPGPDYRSLTVRKNSRGLADLVVTISGVTGRLISDGRADGFSLVGTKPIPCLHAITLQNRRIILHTSRLPDQVEGLSLHYGHGLAPQCNIRDEAGRPLPVFGPIPIVKTRAITPFLRDFKYFVAESDEQLRTRQRPKTAGIPWRNIRFTADHCNVRYEVVKEDWEGKVVFLRSHLFVRERMNLSALVGHDGPIKIWIGRKLLFHDPLGRLPVRPDKHSIPFLLSPGRHEVLVGLGLGWGHSWGFHLRFERTGLGRSRYASGKVQLPEIVGVGA